MPRSINTSGERPSAVMAANTITTAGAWVLVANRRCTFHLTSFAFVCLQTAEQQMFSHRRKPNSTDHHFWPSEVTLLSLFSFCCGVSSCTFWNFNDFIPSLFFNILPNGILRYVQLTSHFSATAASIKSVLYFSNNFCWCCCFFPSTSLTSGYAMFITVTSETQKIYSHLNAGVL